MGNDRETELNKLLNALGLKGTLNLFGSFQDFKNDKVDGYSYGGGVNYGIPTGLGLLTTNLSGGGYKVDTPTGQFSDADLRNIGLLLQKENQQFGINYQPEGAMPIGKIPNDALLANELPNIPVKDYLELQYRYLF
ncbi:MAG: hypothetical protein CM15mV83_080 [uncultured marine virus]|nr:MAG: hypothetical protein CM15mV83_080 [uncultured marine virus]